MRHVYRHLILILFVIVVSVLVIIPPDRKLKLAKDLAGGSTLVYQVDLRPNDPPDTITRVKDLISRRLDPNGVMGISLVVQGGNRIEITMPLPNDAMKKLKAEFESALSALGETNTTPEQVDRAMALPAEQRAAELTRLGAGDPTRTKAFQDAAAAADALSAEVARSTQVLADLAQRRGTAERALEQARTENKDPALVKTLEEELGKAADAEFAASLPAAKASRAYEDAKKAALATVLSAPEVRRVLELSDIDPKYQTSSGNYEPVPSPRKKALARLKESHPGAVAQIDRIVEKWNAYQKERSTLDDPADVRRLLKGAGVLDFRITVKQGEHPQESELRKKLLEGGPLSVQSGDARWFKLNKVEGWFHSAGDYQTYDADPAAFFGRMAYVVERFDGEPYMLCYDTPGMRLTQAEGNWQVASARRSSDQIGKPNIAFAMDALGASKLGELTGANVGKPMAILLDDQVYTAPTLQSRISSQGQITGVETAEIDYIVRVLGAGSMAAKLSPDPVSESTVGPELGADNLQKGLKAGAIAFALVAAFMIVYYFGCGIVAVIALLINAVMILGLMALNHAAFSLPGIAGVVLTFGMAVDANVLIYERLREEMEEGADFRTAIRLGYSRAMASIVDGNTTVFIVSVVLAFFGTQEIKGFAITMIIGSLTTFFTQLYITRVVFYILIEKLGWRNGSMLALKFPVIARSFNPHIDWMKYRYVMLGVSALLVVLSFIAIGSEWSDLLDNDFRGGTKITVQLKNGDDRKPILMSRETAQERVNNAGITSPKALAINPSKDDSTKASRFEIKTTDRESTEVQAKVLEAFRDVVDVQPAIRYSAMNADTASLPVFPLISDSLGENIRQPSVRVPVGDFKGGAAVLIENMEPRPTLAQLEERLRQVRNDPAHEATQGRAHRWVVVAGDEKAVQSAALLVFDENASFVKDPDRWASSLRMQEWRLVADAMSRATSLAGVESFSAAIAQSFAAQAAVSVVFSTVLIIIYIWLRFQSFRYSIGAIMSTLHDCIVAVGMIALCEPIFNKFPGFSQAVGIGPFKIDLNVVAAVLTILGYSLNDTVIVMDRIRETKGKLPFATRKVINDAINQTISRTVITSGLTMLATTTLYFFGGEAIRPFAFTFMVGVVTGTYSSIFIAAPIVWVHKADPTQNPGRGVERVLPA